jgi:hypothetical protein
MNIFVLISRILLGLTFLVFGLNGFLNFIPASMPTGIAGQYIGAPIASHYLAVMFALEFGSGILLLANRFVRVALTILAPILVNIALFHGCMAPPGFAPAVIAVALWSVLFYRVGVHAIGYLANTNEQAAEEFYPGWPPATRAQYDAACRPSVAYLIGDAVTVAEKIAGLSAALGGIARFSFQMSVAALTAEKLKHSVELLGTEVAPLIQHEVAAPSSA